jgi:hypothetical protein
MYVVDDKYKNGLFFYSRILTHGPEMPLDISPVAADLITQLLEKEPSKRLGGGEYYAMEIKSHPFFNVSSFPISVIIQ